MSLICDEFSWKNFENTEDGPTNMQRQSWSKHLDGHDENDKKGRSNQLTCNNLQGNDDDNDDDDDDDLPIVSFIQEDLSWNKLETKES